MARKNKRPNHARLVVPGASRSRKNATPKKDTEKQPQQANPREATGATEGTEPREEAQRPRENNTVELATTGEAVRKKVARRRKRRHRLQALFLVAVFLLAIFIYFSGVYRTAVLKGGELVENIRISLQGGPGYPMDFEIPGFRQTQTMGKNGFVAVGEKDVAILTSDGRELYRFQHGYGNPRVTANESRVCVYNRGGREYTIEGRTGRRFTRTAEQEILFAEMSSGGALALVTTSRFRATLYVYSSYSDDEPKLSWPITEEKPYMAAFQSDNKHLALACLSTVNGALRTNIHLLHSGRSDILATIDGGDATVLQMEYLSGGKLLVLYDSYAATYNANGVETARYTYTESGLAAAHTDGGTSALVFQSVSQDKLTTVVLDASLQQLGSFVTATTQQPRVLVAGKTVYLLAGYTVEAYDTGGALLKQYESEGRGYDLVYGGEPLLVSAGGVIPLNWMTDEEAQGPPVGSEVASAIEATTSGLMPEEPTGTPLVPETPQAEPEESIPEETTQSENPQDPEG